MSCGRVINAQGRGMAVCTRALFVDGTGEQRSGGPSRVKAYPQPDRPSLDSKPDARTPVPSAVASGNPERLFILLCCLSGNGSRTRRLLSQSCVAISRLSSCPPRGPKLPGLAAPAPRPAIQSSPGPTRILNLTLACNPPGSQVLSCRARNSTPSARAIRVLLP